MSLISGERWVLLGLGAWMALLALTTAAYGALAGPALRALFGGDSLRWPDWIAAWITPPSVDTLRAALPWVILGVAAVKGLSFYRQRVGLAAFGERFAHRLRTRAIKRLMSLPPDVAAQRGAGELLARALDDANASRKMVTEGFAVIVRDSAQVVALLGVCLAIDWQMALVAFAVYPIAFWPIARLGRRLRRHAGAARQASADLFAVAHDQLARLPAIQLTGQGQNEAARFGRTSAKLSDAVVAEARIQALASPVTEVMGAATLAISLAYAARLVAAGTVAPEHILSFLVGVLLLYQPVKGLARAQAAIQPGRAAIERVTELLEWPEQLPMGGERVPPKHPEITFERVCVERGGRSVLRDVQMQLPARGLVVIFGPNGAGKSTLLGCLAGVLSPASGRILLGGVPLSAFDLRQWRAQVGWVGQTLSLGRGSVRTNLGLEDLSAAQLHALAEQSGLSAVIDRLPNGWDTALGDHGGGLSGGELQRLALARALARDPQILVLDEPAAHLDPAARRSLKALLPALATSRLVLWVTHDPDAATVAHQTLNLVDGSLR